MKDVRRKIITAAAMTIMLAGCNSEEGLPTGESVQDMAYFSATIQAPGTRAYDQIWEADDEIGISGTSGDKTYTNVRYFTRDNSGSFNPKDEREKIYFQNDEEVTFTAYYPWNDLQGTTAIAADTREQQIQKTFDFLWAQATGQKKVNDSKVQFQFSHKMAKVVLTIKKGSDVNYNEVKAAVLSLGGFKPEGTFSVTDGATAATGEALSAEWTFAGNPTGNDNAPLEKDDTKETVSYTLLLFPQEFGTTLPFTAELTGSQSFTTNLDFTEANRQKDGTNAKNEWVAGRQYNMGIVLNKTGVVVEGCTIAPWEEVTGNDAIAQ